MEHIEGNCRSKRNLSLYYQGWLPDTFPRAVLLVVHGLAEHGGRYLNVVEHFVPKGYALFAPDLRGHGNSEGARGYVGRFSDYLDDMETFTGMVRHRYGQNKLFLIGHSLGGTIAISYAVKYQDALAGLVLSAPTIKVGSSISRRDIVLARLVSVLLPRAGVAALDATAASRDKAVVQSYMSDPLVYRGKICARLGAEVIKVLETSLPSQIPELKLPVLIMQGTADRLSNPEGSTMFYELVGSPDKTLKRFDGLYHEVFNEPEHEEVLTYLETWLAVHL